ncbi:MAG TPA: nitrilase-related carbon-nitrogen hydrolase, partial [Spirochaetales bacterium]|nr:nitrilase-related carbon-nitrogen hydrolase [Spirochaetales bacterium]
MRLGLCQYDIAWEDKEANKRRIEELVAARPRREEIDWLVFSEMCLTGFTMDAELAELSDADRSFFAGLAARLGCNLSYGGVEGGCNKLITLDREGRRVSEYAKIHLYSFGEEDKHYRAGSSPVIFELEGLRVAPAVCFDLRFPYLFWSQAPRVDLFLVVAAWPARRAEHWRGLLYARAVENQAYCAGVNRLGREGKLEFSGGSACFDPLGKVVADSGSAEGI